MTDFVDQDWERISKNAPLIPLSKEFGERSPKDQIDYLWKLASSLDEAAQKTQKERDELNELLFSKEAKINSLEKELSSNRMMIHKQLEIANAKYQKLLEENQGLYAEIKELKCGN